MAIDATLPCPVIYGRTQSNNFLFMDDFVVVVVVVVDDDEFAEFEDGIGHGSNMAVVVASISFSFWCRSITAAHKTNGDDRPASRSLFFCRWPSFPPSPSEFQADDRNATADIEDSLPLMVVHSIFLREIIRW